MAATLLPDDVTASLLLPPPGCRAEPTTTSETLQVMMWEGGKKISDSVIFPCSQFIGSYCEGPSAYWLTAPEQLLQHFLQVVLAVVRDRERIAVVSASDHGRQTWTHGQTGSGEGRNGKGWWADRK